MIDQSIIQPWSEEVLAAVRRFRQGDLVHDPPLFYFGSGASAVLTLTRDTPGDGTPDVYIADDGTMSWGVITTQTCDVQEEGRPKRPWIQVAPVYELTRDEGRWNQIRKKRISYLTHISGLEPGFWIADTRIEMPIEKSWLVQSASVRGFETEDEYLAFADHLAANRRRPALAASILDHLVNPLKASLDALPTEEATELLDPVEEILLDVAGDRVTPESVQLVVLCKGDCPAHVREWFEGWWDGARAAADDELALLRPRFEHGGQDGLPVDEHRRMVALSWSDLSPGDG